MKDPFLPNRIELYCLPVDLRKGQDGLLSLIEDKLCKDSTEGILFIFSNRSRSLIKGLFWDRSGYCLLSKRLLNGRFVLPFKSEKVELDQKSLRMFMDGLDLFCNQ